MSFSFSENPSPTSRQKFCLAKAFPPRSARAAELRQNRLARCGYHHCGKRAVARRAIRKVGLRPRNAIHWEHRELVCTLLAVPTAPDIVQTGLLSLEHSHGDILRQARDYPETVMYEMPALSLCISQSGVGYHLDRRFNALLGTLMLDYAPRWIVTNKPLKELLWQLHYPPLRRAVREVCAKNWFIHAAGAKRDLDKVSNYFSRLNERHLSR